MPETPSIEIELHAVFSPVAIRFHVIEVVSSLAELHAAGITYCDLKPENVLLHLGGGTDTGAAMLQYGGAGCALAKIVIAGGGEGIFHVLLRTAMHLNRPPALEVRPHPLRETQLGAFLRTLACNPQGQQLWAGAKSGVWVWGFHKVCRGWWLDASLRRHGDEQATPFRESVPVPPALCAAADDKGMV